MAMMVKDLPVGERPVNRVQEVGSGALSLRELLACLLQTGDALNQAEALVVKFPTLVDLERAGVHGLTSVEGVGPAQAARILAALELGRRAVTEQALERVQVRAPGDAANVLLPMLSYQAQECFVVVYLDTRNRILDIETLYRGTLNTSVVRIAEVFHGAVQRHCAGIIIAHNHPSGDPNPSPEDVALTRRLVEAGKLMEVEVLDHVVVGQGRYVSLRERGIGFDV